MNKPLRVDLVFSYWIYAWYILYTFRITDYSPKFALILGAIDNIGLFILMLLYGTSNETIFYFIIVNFLIKGLPLYFLRNETLLKKDIYFTILLFGLFLIWLHINKQSLIGNMKLIYESLLYSKNKTPFMAFIQTFKQNIQNLRII